MKSNIALVTVLLSFVVLASGCIDQQQNEPANPTNPVIVDSQQRQGVFDTVQGESTIQVDVLNNGSSGDVRVFANILGENDIVLTRENQTVYIGENETRRVQMRFDVPEGAESYRLEVEAVQEQ